MIKNCVIEKQTDDEFFNGSISDEIDRCQVFIAESILQSQENLSFIFYY